MCRKEGNHVTILFNLSLQFFFIAHWFEFWGSFRICCLLSPRYGNGHGGVGGRGGDGRYANRAPGMN